LASLESELAASQPSLSDLPCTEMEAALTPLIGVLFLSDYFELKGRVAPTEIDRRFSAA
jgi:hypothetical protein